jgi:hypothetical protein
MTPYRRRKKLIQPRLQIRLVASFLAMSALSLLLQYIVFVSSLAELASDLPQDGFVVLERIPHYVLRTALVSVGIALPISFMVGVLITFRVAGPVYRLERFLSEIIRGEKPVDCRLRKGDELQELCALVNSATASLRASSSIAPAAPAANERADRNTRASSHATNVSSVEIPAPLPAAADASFERATGGEADAESA